MITLLTAIDPNNTIGNHGKTPWDIPEELKLFKKITYGHAVIMGRKTYESIGHALPGRKMFVLSRSPHPNPLPIRGEGSIIFCTSVQDALEQTKQERSVFVIGGGQVYAQMMPLADELLISHIHQEYSGDVFFLNIDQRIWQEVSRTEYPRFTHIHYIRNEQPSKNR